MKKLLSFTLAALLTCALLTVGAKGIEATPTASKVLVDGKETSFEAYNIGGNNFVKLRDLGQLLDFGVRWEDAVVIDTATGYVAP